MKLYTIRFCKKCELAKLQHFIDKHWRKDHILSYSKKMFLFQHEKYDCDYYSFVVAENNVTKEFDAVYGYILTHKYDTTKQIPNVAWGAIWKTRDDIFNKEKGSLGLGMLKFIIKNENIDSFASLGISKIHKDLSIGLGFQVGTMNHYYYANNKIDNFKLAVNPLISDLTKESDSKLKELEWDSLPSIPNSMNPYKNICYFENRYHKHPFFKYRLFGLFDKEELNALFVIRKVRAEGSSCLRIIDMIGDLSKANNINVSLQSILITENAEYIDCWNHGIKKEFFLKIGFTEVAGLTIIPDYFSPYEASNITLEYDNLNEDNIVIFKGDADQDRPNSEIIEI